MLKKSFFKKAYSRIEQLPFFMYLLKWVLITAVIGAIVGSASALLLVSLNYATNFREGHHWMILFLPIAGLLIGLMYKYLGKSVAKGNNYLLEELHSPKDIIPFKMAPLIYLGTIITHLFGGSAGREGTAVQIGGAISDQFSYLFRLNKMDRKIMVVIGISAGFASVFGTPLAGAVFALEVIITGRMRYDSILPSFLAAIFADTACRLWGVQHAHYAISSVPHLTVFTILMVLIAGIIFGIVAMVFSKTMYLWHKLFARIKYEPLRPFIGGFVIVAVVYLLGTTKYIGLGLPTISASFTDYQQWYVFLIKLLLTTFTLGVGFKGGEVTPLFYIGATLGSALCVILPLPMSLLAGMGFVAVFAGATNTPIACTLMGIELFGAQSGVYMAIACVVAYLFSGHTGIYTSQIIGTPKHRRYNNLKGKQLR